MTEKNAMSSSEGPQLRSIIPGQRARQGVTGRYVLGFALAAVIVVFGVIWLIYFA
jgi:hypothetical protein